MKIQGKYLQVIAAMCGISVATIGLIVNVAGLFFTPMAEEFGVLQGAASLVLTISNISMALGGLATRSLTQRLPLRALLIGATCLLVGSCLGTAIAPGMLVVYVCAALKGLAAGITGFVIISLILNRWFAAQTGFATSIAMGCSGLGGALFSPVVQAAVNGLGWRGAQVVVGVLMAAFMLPSILLVPSYDPKVVGMAAFGADEVTRTASVQAKTSAPRSDVNKVLFAASAVFAVLCGAVSALPQHFPGMSNVAGFAATGATMLSMCMISNTVGKIAMGWLCDRLGAKATLLGYLVAEAVALVVFLLVPASGPYVVAALVAGLSYSPGTVGLTALCRELFGEAGAGVVYPVSNMAYSFSNAIFSSAIGFAFDLTGGYALTLVAFLVFIAATAVVVLWSYGYRNRA